MICTNIVLGAELLRARPITYAYGRLLPLKFAAFEPIERPLLVRPDIRPGRMFA
jgi:hypothetical protein